MSMGRPDLESFQVGQLYRHDDTEEVVEFLGVACIPELDGETVACFRFLGGGCLIATRKTYNQGERFTPAGDAFEEERELDGG